MFYNSLSLYLCPVLFILELHHSCAFAKGYIQSSEVVSGLHCI